MESFSLLDAQYSYEYYNPQIGARYGLGIGFWYGIMPELLFFLQYINKHWINRHKIDIAICSYAPVRAEWYDEIKSYVNYIVHCEQDHGKERGTMYHLNGAFYPIWQNPTVQTIAHTDADEIIINAQYFFGLSNMLLDADKAILGAQAAYAYDMNTMTEERLCESEWEPDSLWYETMQPFIILNKNRIEFGKYYPIQCHVNFCRDLWRHIGGSGMDIDELLVLKRHEWNRDVPTNFLYSFDLHTGILRSANRLEYPETEDRKMRLLKLMTIPIWDGVPEGWAYYHSNGLSHRDNYRIVHEPPYGGYEPKLASARPNKPR